MDPDLLAKLACPEDLSPLRLATDDELADIRQRLAGGDLRQRDGTPANIAPDAVLIRADGKVGYAVAEGFPRLVIDLGLVLDPDVPPPDPDKYRQ